MTDKQKNIIQTVGSTRSTVRMEQKKNSVAKIIINEDEEKIFMWAHPCSVDTTLFIGISV